MPFNGATVTLALMEQNTLGLQNNIKRNVVKDTEESANKSPKFLENLVAFDLKPLPIQ